MTKLSTVGPQRPLHSSYDDLLIQDDHSADDVVQILFAALNRMKEERDATISIIETLAAERTRLRAHIAAQSGSSRTAELAVPKGWS